MIEIRFHGRGGQGAVTAAKIIAQALLNEGKYSLHFPEFGVERRGAPVMAFLRIDDKEILLRSKTYSPDIPYIDIVVVFDFSLIEKTKAISGLKEDGWLIVNSSKTPEEFRHFGNFKIVTVDATRIALNHEIGAKNSPIVNTVITGALAKILGISFESLLEPMKKEFGKFAEKNIKGAKEAYEAMKIVEGARNEKK